MPTAGKTGLDLRPGPFLKLAASRLDAASRRGLPVTVAWTLSAFFFVAFVSIAERVVEPLSLAADRAAAAVVAATAGPGVKSIMWFFTLFGNARVAVVGALVAAILLAVWGHPRRAGSVVLLMLVSSGLAEGLKHLVDRPRPPEALQFVALPASASFPSGHAMAGIVLAGTLALMLVASRSPRIVRMAGSVGMVAAGMMVGVSRVYLGVHYFSDVLGSWCLGAALVGLWAAAVLTWGRAVPPDPAARASAEGTWWRWSLTVAGLLVVAIAVVTEMGAMRFTR